MNAFSPLTFNPRAVVVAIPVHNEEEHIAACLESLARQDYASPFAVVAFLNNCTDATVATIRRLTSRLPFRLYAPERRLDPDQANAGMARRLAVREAQDIVAADGVVLTTDADSRMPPDWISAHMAMIEAGADAVAGMVEMDSTDAAALPGWLLEDEDRAQAFGTLLDEIDWRIDPDPHDPWPRHIQHSGANIAVRAAALARVNGIPGVPLGEDRALFAELRRMDARIRHSRQGVVTVSGRLEGRAKGGMADTIARRMREPDEWLDDCFEPAADRLRRASLRAALRQAWRTGDVDVEPLAGRLLVSSSLLRGILSQVTFGNVWGDLENTSPVLRHRMVRAVDLEKETGKARATLRSLRGTGENDAQVYPADSERFVSA